MARPKKTAVRYLTHPCGRARALWNDATGPRVRMLPGLFNSPESLQAFAKLQLELASSPSMPTPSATGPTVVEVFAPYLRYAEGYYGPCTGLQHVKVAAKIVRELYGMEPVAEFGPKKLAAVREAFIRKGWSRPYVNSQVGRLIRAFKWAAAEELALASVYQALKTLSPLRRGHCSAPEPEARLPADPTHVAATIPFLPPHVRAIVALLRSTGMRPFEACWMTLDQIDRTGPLWIYRPTKHKNAHRGKVRTITLGAAAQAVITVFLAGRTIGEAEPIFSPRRQREERSAKMRAERKSKVQPSQVSRKKANGERLPGERFTTNGIGHAIVKSAKRAGVPTWSAYQLRHLKGGELRERFSLEHVRAALGHSHASMSAHYAKGADAKLAAEVAATTG